MNLIIALRSLVNGRVASIWEQQTLTTNRTAVGIGEQFEVLYNVNGDWVPFQIADPTPPPPPVPPMPPPPVGPYVPGQSDPQTWFMQMVANQPFGQATLIADEPFLNANGWLLTPPNANGDRTKVRPPDYPNYFRVGFGEGHWVWITEPV